MFCRFINWSCSRLWWWCNTYMSSLWWVCTASFNKTFRHSW